jgi:cytochrome P450
VHGASSIPVALSQLQGRLHRYTNAAHAKYGPVVRISPNELSFISPEAWNEIYGRQYGKTPFPRDSTFFNEMLVDSRTLTMADDVNHARLRRAMIPAFASRMLKGRKP